LALFGRRPSERVERPSFRRPKTCTEPASRAAKKGRRDLDLKAPSAKHRAAEREL